MNELLVQKGEGLLVSGSTPVWPARDDEDVRALAVAAECFGMNLRVVADAKPARRARAGHGRVAAFGEEAVRAATLYAHLTGREIVHAGDAEALVDLRADVVVTLERRLHDDLLLALYEHHAPGLVVAEDLAGLHREVLVRSAARFAKGPLRTRRVDICSELEGGDMTAAGVPILGRDAPLERCRQLLACGSGVLTLTGHSGGIDAPLPSGGMLCPRSDVSAPRDPSGAPNCVRAGFCVVRQKPMLEVLASGTFVSPDVIRTRIFLYNVCWGLRSPVGLVDWEWSACRRLLENPAIGALITSWSVVRTSPAGVNALLDAIANGAPIGEAVAAHNRGVPGWERALLCILGDPAVSLPAPDERIDFSVLPVRQRPPSPAYRRTANAAFLRASLEPSPLFSDLRAPLQHFESVAYGRTLGEAVLPAMRSAVIDGLLSQSLPLFRLWSDMSFDCTPEARRCRGCGRIAQAYVHQLRVLGLAARRVTVCPKCGLAEDCPSEVELSFEVVNPRTVRLRDADALVGFSGVLTVEQSLHALRLAWPWPQSEEGRPCEVFELPRPLPEGPFHISLAAVWGDLEIAVLGRFMRCDRTPLARLGART